MIGAAWLKPLRPEFEKRWNPPPGLSGQEIDEANLMLVHRPSLG